MAAQGKLAGETAIVTAAGQGLGEEISKRFASEGAQIAVVDINEAEAQRVAGEINAAGGSAVAYKCDATKKVEVTAMVDAVLRQFGTVDILINAAGGFHQFAPITEIAETFECGAPPRLWVRPKVGFFNWRGPARPSSWR